MGCQIQCKTKNFYFFYVQYILVYYLYVSWNFSFNFFFVSSDQSRWMYASSLGEWRNIKVCTPKIKGNQIRFNYLHNFRKFCQWFISWKINRYVNNIFSWYLMYEGKKRSIDNWNTPSYFFYRWIFFFKRERIIRK